MDKIKKILGEQPLAPPGFEGDRKTSRRAAQPLE